MAYRFALVCVAGILSSGCATNVQTIESAEVKSAAVVQFKSLAVSDELKRSGLSQVFSDYWVSHSVKNWKRRYGLEVFQAPVDEKFYVAYHANAWQLLSIEVGDIQLTDAGASVTATMTYADPEKRKDLAVLLVDKWKLVNGEWRHVFDDPMLNSLKR
jgi:hypothetical protein